MCSMHRQSRSPEVCCGISRRTSGFHVGAHCALHVVVAEIQEPACRGVARRSSPFRCIRARRDRTISSAMGRSRAPTCALAQPIAALMRRCYRSSAARPVGKLTTSNRWSSSTRTPSTSELLPSRSSPQGPSGNATWRHCGSSPPIRAALSQQ